ncbi:MAG: hypothetical protein GEV07_08660 [Streptosporangiales bacterium]|nr:hypothetical protein [Streptosporangiales bacterium]
MRQNHRVDKSAPLADKVDEKARVGWVFGWGWMLFAAVNAVDILRHDWTRGSAYAGSVLLVVSGVVWVIALRPRLRADADRMLLRNPLRDVEIPWGAVEEIESRDTIRVRTARRHYHSWVGHVSNRRRAWFTRSQVQGRAAELTMDRTGRTSAQQSSDKEHLAAAAQATTTEYLAQRLTGMADQFGRKSAEAGHTEVTVKWSWPAVVALVVPTLLFVASLVLG